MNIKKSILPLAIAVVSIGGMTLHSGKLQDNDAKNKTEATLSEKEVFDYMKHTSSPIQGHNGVNLAIGLFGLGLAGAKRKEEVLGLVDEIEEIVSKKNEYSSSEKITGECKMFREYLNKTQLDKNDENDIKTLVENMAFNLTGHIHDSEYDEALQKVYKIRQLLNTDYTSNNEEYKKECLKEIDGIKECLSSASNPIMQTGTLKLYIDSLRRLILEGESDNSEDIKSEILKVLERYEYLLDVSSNIRTEEFAVEGYKKIPLLTYLVEKYTTPNADWEKKESSAKNRYPQIWNNQEYTEEYAHFASQVLNNCRKLKRATKNQEIREIEPLIRMIKTSMLNYGTYDNQAFAYAMSLSDEILSSNIDRQGKAYNLGSLTFKVKALLENIYTSVNNPKYNRPNGTVPRTFQEWESEMARIEKFPPKPDYSKFHKIKPETLLGEKIEMFKKEKDPEEIIKKTSTNSNKKVNEVNNEKITFANVGGQDKAIEMLKKKVLYPVKYPNAFKNRMLSHGIVMYGRPGTGKTLIALALSNEASANFIKINASELTTSLHGETDKNWRDLFQKAREQQPCIIFIDEFDTVAQKRGHNATNNYDDTVVNTILTEMSDIEKNGDNVFVIGATNRFQELDAGILRAGRFGTHIELKAPETIKDILQIFDIHTRDKVLADDIDKNKLAEMMLAKSVTGSDIASIINEALENTFVRLGIYEKMENGTFDDNDLSYIQTTMEDFVNAIENCEIINDKTTQKRRQIGFNQR